MPIKIFVEDIRVISIKPKVKETKLQFVITTRNEYDIHETLWVDIDKFNKEDVEKAIKKLHSTRMGIPPQYFEIEWLVTPPEVRRSE